MIYFLLPYTPFEPVGGVQTAFDYALRLNELAGKKIAAVLSDSQYISAWLPKTYKSIKVLPTETKVRPEDTLIIPEVSLEKAKWYPNVKRKLLMVLNWKYFEDNLKKHRLQKLGFSGILTNSSYSLRKLLPKAEKLPVWHIPHRIDTSAFRSFQPIADRPKHSVLILNRKNTNHIPPILDFLKGISHTATILNNISADKMPAMYAKHQIFINLGYPEGFCRPAAEAMASGCVVVGFNGGGGSDFMISGANSLIAEDGNEEQLLAQLHRAIHMSDDQKQLLANNAREIITTCYTKQHQAETLAIVFPNEIGKLLTSAEIARIYRQPVKKNTPPREAKAITIAPAKTVEVLEYQLYQERMQNQAVTNSKFFKIWQGYCSLREKILRATEFSRPSQSPTQA